MCVCLFPSSPRSDTRTRVETPTGIGRRRWPVERQAGNCGGGSDPPQRRMNGGQRQTPPFPACHFGRFAAVDPSSQQWKSRGSAAGARPPLQRGHSLRSAESLKRGPCLLPQAECCLRLSGAQPPAPVWSTTRRLPLSPTLEESAQRVDRPEALKLILRALLVRD